MEQAHRLLHVHRAPPIVVLKRHKKKKGVGNWEGHSAYVSSNLRDMPNTVSLADFCSKPTYDLDGLAVLMKETKTEKIIERCLIGLRSAKFPYHSSNPTQAGKDAVETGRCNTREGL